MLRNKLSIIVYIVLLSITCVNLVACGNNDVNDENKNFVHDATKWFTEEELSTKGLAGLTAPIGLSGDIQSSDTWFNSGYSFSQVCPNEDTFKTNAEIYFSYLKTNLLSPPPLSIPNNKLELKDLNKITTEVAIIISLAISLVSSLTL